MDTPTILNSKGNPIVLNEREQHNAKWMASNLWIQYGPQKSIRNSIGYEIAITTLTTITKKVSEQKFYQVKPSDFIPIIAGEGTWSSNLETYRSFDISDVFESGIIDTGGNNDRLSSADAAVDALQIKVYNWAKSLGYSIFDLELAAKSGNWDLVAAKEKSRKRNYDLGIQKIAFLGAQGQNGAGGSCLGLLNQPGITFNSTVITKAISSMSPTELSAFQQAIIQAYQVNNNYTAMPTHFAVPQADFNGMVAQASASFPMKTILELLVEGFKIITNNPNFKVLPIAYASASVAGSGVLPSGANTGLYALYNYDEESLRMSVPLPYTTSLANSINNFQFQNVGYSQFTGVLALRPLEILYAGY